MRRARLVLPGGEIDRSRVIDRVILAADERHRRRAVLTGEAGTELLLDLREAIVLRDGDGLVLNDGTIVRVTAKPEPLLEVVGRDAQHLARLAWHLGNRHTDVAIVGDTLHLRRDHVLAEMLIGLGARVGEIEAPFEPEQGAYAGGHAHQAGHHGEDDHGK